jgi:hypothetical protein
MFFGLFDISSGRQLKADDPQMDTEFEAVANLFDLMPMLEVLDIHIYDTTTRTTRILEEHSYENFLESVFRYTDFPRLAMTHFTGASDRCKDNGPHLLSKPPTTVSEFGRHVSD